MQSSPQIDSPPSISPSQPSTWLAFSIYLALSLLFFARGLIGHLGDRYLGIGTDPGLFIFFLEWWKYALAHHLNPFFTYLQWAPTGANLTWATCIPLFGIAAIPLTSALGPVATFNLLTLLCLPLAATTAFLLCRYLTSSPWAPLFGGYVFGFSPWMLSHLLGHLTVLMIFPVPLMVLVTLRRLDGELGARTFSFTLTALIVALFLCWPEALATATLFGGCAIALAWITAPPMRTCLLGLFLPTSLAYLAGAAILSPYLYYFFAFGQPAFPGGLRQIVSVHPLNFLIPSPANQLGTFPLFTSMLAGHIYETGAYIALPIVLIVVSYARTGWADWRCRLLVNLLLVVAVASMGATLDLPDHRSIPLPWGIVAHLPLLDKALPARFSLYAFLLLAVILSLWLSDLAVRINLRIAGACAVALLSLPNLNSAFWTTPVDTPAFFSSGAYKRYIAPGDNVLILPYGEVANSNIWQAASSFYFRMAGGYLGQPPIPTDYLPYFPIVYDLYNLAPSPGAAELLKMFLAQMQVNAIVVAGDGPLLWRNNLTPGPQFPVATYLDADEKTTLQALFATLGAAPVHLGGVSFYRVPLKQLDACRDLDPRPLVRQIVTAQLGAVIQAAHQYLAAGHPLDKLYLVEVQRLGLLPPRWVSGVGIFHPRDLVQNGLVLAPLPNGHVLAGVIGTRPDLAMLALTYRPFAQSVQVAPLMGLAGWAESSRSILLLDFAPAQLARAAGLALASPAHPRCGCLSPRPLSPQPASARSLAEYHPVGHAPRFR